MGYHSHITERSSAPVQKVPSYKRTQPLRHFAMTLTDDEHRVLKKAASKTRGFSHPFIRYIDEGITLVQGRNGKKIIAELRELFPDIEITPQVPEFFIRNY